MFAAAFDDGAQGMEDVFVSGVVLQADEQGAVLSHEHGVELQDCFRAAGILVGCGVAFVDAEEVEGFDGGTELVRDADVAFEFVAQGGGGDVLLEGFHGAVPAFGEDAVEVRIAAAEVFDGFGASLGEVVAFGFECDVPVGVVVEFGGGAAVLVDAVEELEGGLPDFFA